MDDEIDRDVAGTARRAVHQLLAEHGTLTTTRLGALLQAQGVATWDEPAQVVHDLLMYADLGPVALVHDDQVVWLPWLLAGRTFTHRVGAQEVDDGVLVPGADLAALWSLVEHPPHDQVDGAPLRVVFLDHDGRVIAEDGGAVPADRTLSLPPDQGCWLLERDVLTSRGVAAGDLVGVRVLEGGLTLTKVEESSLTDPDRVATTLVGLMQRAGEEPAADDDAPGASAVETLVARACAADPDLFLTPVAPLAELFAAADMVVADGIVLPPGVTLDDELARQDADDLADRLDGLVAAYGFDEDTALAVVALAGICQEIGHDALDADADADADELTVATAGDALQRHAQRVLAEPETSQSDRLGELEGPEGLDADTVLQLLRLLADPVVAEALLSETLGPEPGEVSRLNAAGLGAFAAAVEAKAHRSVRPALSWLRGRAHERLAAVTDAELAYEDALALDPEWPPALIDLARIASDRGDAERGLSLLRRAGAREDDRLVVLLQRFTATDRRDLGRNDPCWCGSGRKYKVCHRGREVRSLVDRLPWLVAKVDQYLDDGPWRPALVELAEHRVGPLADDDAVWDAAADPLLRDVVVVEGGALAGYLHDRGSLLPPDEREVVESWTAVPRRAYEVVGRPAAGTVRARHLATGEEVDLAASTPAGTRPGSVAALVVVEVDGAPHVVGPWLAVTPDAVAGVSAVLERDPDAHTLLDALDGVRQEGPAEDARAASGRWPGRG